MKFEIENELKALKMKREFLWTNLAEREEQKQIILEAAEILENEMIEEDVKMLFKNSIVRPHEIEIESVEFELSEIEDEINKLEIRAKKLN